MLCLALVMSLAALAGLSEAQSPGEPRAGDCRFPDWLQSRPRWEGKISYARRKTAVYWKFYENVVERIDYSTQFPQRSEQACAEQLPDNKFLLRATDGATEKYVCMQFLKRSDHVIQIKLSDRSPVRNAALCDDDNLLLDKWPLVWPKADEKFIPCPLVGGFDFYMTDHTNAETTCEETFLMPHLESECMTGEGLKLDFRHFECRGRIDMELVTEFVSLGNWEDGGYTYSVLTDRDELWPKIWLLRYPTDHGNVFKANLFSDVVAEQTETPRLTKRYYTLYMKRTVFSSLCDNEATYCGGECGQNEARYCQKECTGCDDTLGVPKCTFPDESRGEWLEISDRGQRGITVTSSMVYPEGMLPLQCYDLNAQAWFKGQGRRALATIFKNGCRPRYTCAEFRRLSDGVALHRLSQNLVWPQAVSITAETVCDDAVFQDDPAPLGNRIRSANPKALIKKVGLHGRREAAACNIDKYIGLRAHYRNSGDPTWCDAELNACYSNTSFSLRLFPGCTQLHESSLASYGCLASWGEEGDRFVITVNKEDASDLKCWLFHRDPWSSTTRVFLMQPSECHEDAALNIEYKNHTNYIAQFEVQSPESASCEAGLAATHHAGARTTPTPERTSRVVTFSRSTESEIHHTTRVPARTAPTAPRGPDLRPGRGNGLDRGADKTLASLQQGTSGQQTLLPAISIMLLLILTSVIM